MARKRTRMERIRDIIRLRLSTELSERQIRRALKVSRTVVAKTVTQWRSSGLEAGVIAGMGDSALEEAEQDRVYEGSVNYRDFSPKAVNARTFNGDKLKEMSIEEYVAGHLDGHYKALFLEKAQDYRDENEYRFIFANSAPGLAYVPIDGCLEAVIVGVLLPTVYRDLIAQSAHELGAEYKSLEWHNGRPYLSDR